MGKAEQGILSRHSSILGIDIGGTYLRAGKIENFKIGKIHSKKISSKSDESVVLNELFEAIDLEITPEVAGIGVGVPSVMDIEKGIVYDVQNIPSWKAVPLRDILQDRYHIPVFMNNDANCFVIGEKYFGHGKNYHSLVGIIMGTGFGAGLVIHDKLYTGRNCGAGEFGMIAYRDRNYEYYCSGQFFRNLHGMDGEGVYKKAKEGDSKALQIFEEFGRHVGEALKTVLFAVDPEIIIFGGSVSKAFPYFQKSMHQVLDTFPYSTGAVNIKIEVNHIQHIAVLGAAALCFDQMG